MTLEAFEATVRSRRATRHFRPDPVSPELLERLLDSARWSPSGYNLQPTHYVIVTDSALKSTLHKACLEQNQILEAPAVVVFVGLRRVLESHFAKTLTLDLEAGAINRDYEHLLRKTVPLAFSHAPLGLSWLWKATLVPFVRFVKPLPSIPAVQKRYWVTKQVMLSAMVFMLAATSAGLATVPMEGFDEGRVKRILKIPRSCIVPVVIPLGYPLDGTLKKTRLPLGDLIHREGW